MNQPVAGAAAARSQGVAQLKAFRATVVANIAALSDQPGYGPLPREIAGGAFREKFGELLSRRGNMLAGEVEVLKHTDQAIAALEADQPGSDAEVLRLLDLLILAR